VALIDLFTPILNALKRALGPFGKLFDLVSQTFTGFKASFTKGLELSVEIISEIHEWRNFREQINVRTGVVNLPKAIEQTEALLEQIRLAWDSIVDLAKELQKQAQGQQESPTEEAEQALKDIEGSGIRGLLEKFPKLAKGLEKLLGFLAIVVGALESIQKAIDDLKNIVDAIKGIREEIETGSTIFLQQKNPRRIVQLTEGGSIKIRVGNLHS